MGRNPVDPLERKYKCRVCGTIKPLFAFGMKYITIHRRSGVAEENLVPAYTACKQCRALAEAARTFKVEADPSGDFRRGAVFTDEDLALSLAAGYFSPGMVVRRGLEQFRVVVDRKGPCLASQQKKLRPHGPRLVAVR